MKVFALLICSFVATSVAQQRIAQRTPLQQNAAAQQVDAEKRPNVPILAQESNLQHDGTFNYLFERWVRQHRKCASVKLMSID